MRLTVNAADPSIAMVIAWKCFELVPNSISAGLRVGVLRRDLMGTMKLTSIGTLR